MTPSPAAPRPEFPWLRIVAIVAVMAMAVSAFWLVIRGTSDTDIGPPAPTAPSVPASPGATPGTPRVSTPGADATPDRPEEPAWPEGSLPDLLGYAPDRLADGSLPLNDIARYADISRWTSGLGIATPGSLDDPGLRRWEAALDPLDIPSSLRERGLDPAWHATYGFDLTEVEQVLIIGQAPDYVLVLKGRFDPGALQRAWVDSGYQSIEVEGTTVWSLLPGDSIDLSAPASRLAMGTLNNVVLLEDGTLVAAAKTSRIGAALAVVNGDAPSLAENEDIAALLSPGLPTEALASAMIAKGSLLQATAANLPELGATPVSPRATPDVPVAMPEVRVVLMGMPMLSAAAQATPATETDASQPVAMLLVVDGEGAEAAVEVVGARLAGSRSPQTGRPYADRLVEPAFGIFDGDGLAVVTVTATLVNGPADWLAILGTRDLGFAFWIPEE